MAVSMSVCGPFLHVAREAVELLGEEKARTVPSSSLPCGEVRVREVIIP